MKKMIVLMLAIGALSSLQAQTYKADVSDSQVKWLGKKVTGEHTGFINLKEGKLLAENGKITGGNFIVDMSSITNIDIESAEYNAKLVGHLKSDDFFGVEKYPNATFKIKSVKAVKESNASHHFTGDITIKETTKEITIPAVVKIEGDVITANATFDIDRSDFDVRYGSGSFFSDLGDNLIYDDFNLSINLVAKK
ncbi:YceI family protein [Hyphobacterium sp. CCMP332]|nr:YceI family protein [Hyphobacterium sp. CCMP332]